jgi:hypothetical protein
MDAIDLGLKELVSIPPTDIGEVVREAINASQPEDDLAAQFVAALQKQFETEE